MPAVADEIYVEVGSIQELSESITTANNNKDDHYTIVINRSIPVFDNPEGAKYPMAIMGNITLTTNSSANNTIYRTKMETAYTTGMFTMQEGGKLTIRNNSSHILTLDGGEISGNKEPLVWIKSGGMFTLEDGGLSNNIATRAGQPAEGGGGGVYVEGTFEMKGGTISGNTVNTVGGGVYIKGGTFTMSGGTISSNNATDYGGGVYVYDSIFNMWGGTISSNNAENYGGGVYVNSAGTFTMSDGTISRNTADIYGGGVFVNPGGAFEMDDGMIIANKAMASNGGGGG
jgi:hypothetical protein